MKMYFWNVFKCSFDTLHRNMGVLGVKNCKIMKMEFKCFFDFSSTRQKTIPMSKRKRGEGQQRQQPKKGK